MAPIVQVAQLNRSLVLLVTTVLLKVNGQSSALEGSTVLARVKCIISAIMGPIALQEVANLSSAQMELSALDIQTILM